MTHTPNSSPNGNPNSNPVSGPVSNPNSSPNSASASSPDHDIDRVLTALRAADPAPAMQQRILHRLETASAPDTLARPRPSGHPSPLHWSLTWATAGITAITLAGALFWMAFRTSQANTGLKTAGRNSVLQPAGRSSGPQAAGRNSVPQPAAGSSGLQATESGPHREGASAPALAHSPTTTALRTRHLAHDTPHHAPGQPGRPIPETPLTDPLTNQERLLLHLVQTRTLGDLALLNPETEARQQAEQARDFANFFPDPAPLPDQPPPPDQPPANKTEKTTQPVPTIERNTP